MSLPRRLRRAVKELLGRPQWPLPASTTPQTFDEQLYAAITQPGDVVYDVGANVGNAALFFAACTGRTGQVFAFEPVWATYRRLCAALRVVDDRATVIPIPMGLGDRAGLVPIALPENDSETASLAGVDLLDANRTVTTFTITLTTLDLWRAQTSAPRPDVIKIDVEGAERLVLHGASALFTETRPVLVLEVFAPWQRHFGYGPMDLFAILDAYGYAYRFACQNGLVAHRPTASAPFPKGFEAGYQVLAYHPDTHPDRLTRADRLAAGRPGVLPFAPPPLPNRIAAL